MTTVRSVLHPGWLEVTGPGVHAVVAAAERHLGLLTTAAEDGLVGLLEALTSHGLGGAPDLAAVSVGDGVVRVVVRGSGSVVLADGTRIGSEGRLPWRDLDVTEDAAGGEVSVEAPEPAVPRGWQRPARLSRPTPTAAAPERADIDQSDDLVPDGGGRGRADIDQSDDLVPDGGGRGRADFDQSDDLVPDGDASAHTADPGVPAGAARSGQPPTAELPVQAPPPPGGSRSPYWSKSAHPGGGEGEPAAASAPLAADGHPAAEEHPADGEGPVADGHPAGEGHPADGEGPVADGHPAAEEHPADGEGPVAVGHSAEGEPAADGDSAGDDDLHRPVVLAVLCGAGHPSPPHAAVCRSCGGRIPPQQPVRTPRPSLGVLRVSTGGVVPLDRGVLLGRAPRVDEELPPSERPHVLRVGGADRDISRNHAEVVLEGWRVLVRDLGSTNGTTLTLPGQEPVRLPPSEDHGIEPGAVITLADEVSLTYEVDP